MDRVLDFSAPLDVNLLDSVVDTFYNGTGAARLEAQRVVQQFAEDPRAWHTADRILTTSRSQSTKFLALSMLDNTIKVCFCFICVATPLTTSLFHSHNSCFKTTTNSPFVLTTNNRKYSSNGKHCHASNVLRSGTLY